MYPLWLHRRTMVRAYQPKSCLHLFHRYPSGLVKTHKQAGQNCDHSCSAHRARQEEQQAPVGAARPRLFSTSAILPSEMATVSSVASLSVSVSITLTRVM